MKITLLVIALAAAAFIALASCGSKPKNENVICGGPGIGIDSAYVEALSLPRPESYEDAGAFFVPLPQGWKVVETFEGGATVRRDTTESVANPAITIQVDSPDGKTPGEVIAEVVSSTNGTKIPNIKITDVTYKACEYEENGVKHQLLVGKKDYKLFRFNIINSDADNPELRTIIHYIDVKYDVK